MVTENDAPQLLLVEDDDNDHYFFCRALKRSGLAYTVHHVFHGRAAIDFLQAAAESNTLPQIMFLDLKLPVLNGFDVLAWMQKQTFPAPVPVIVLSGSEQQQDKDRARQLGAVEYVVKPLKVADLERLLRNFSPGATS
jgi:CheY-like chemotaxis protein